ncbi:hypothetical protein EVAR_98314_1 [Eumeta japonica]|uniref:Uncharacterized protein n=1 Tax=Eumeta variegata TaxID=151549 RepID=A0A4C1X9C8_EUMVA|nr:hypothetical protein EVAR_98314_1 [Eumeta japonica]
MIDSVSLWCQNEVSVRKIAAASSAHITSQRFRLDRFRLTSLAQRYRRFAFQNGNYKFWYFKSKRSLRTPESSYSRVLPASPRPQPRYNRLREDAPRSGRIGPDTTA